MRTLGFLNAPWRMRCISIFLFSFFLLLSDCYTSLHKGSECIVLCFPGRVCAVYALKHHWASKLLGVKADSVVAMATCTVSFVAPLSDAETNEKTRVGYYTFTKRSALQADQLTASA